MIDKVERYKITNGTTYETLEEAEFHEAHNQLDGLCDRTMSDLDGTVVVADIVVVLANNADVFAAALQDYSLKKKVRAMALEKARQEAESAKPILQAKPKRGRA